MSPPLAVGTKAFYVAHDCHRGDPGYHSEPWPAVAAEQVFGEGGSCPALQIRHPNGYVVLHYPLEGESAVPHDPTGRTPHSYHLEGEGDGGA